MSQRGERKVNNIQIEVAIEQAERFISVAKQAQKRIRNDFTKDQERLELINLSVYSTTSKETAACRRASMDLTRSLAQLRRR